MSLAPDGGNDAAPRVYENWFSGKNWLNRKAPEVWARLTAMDSLISLSMLPLALSAFEKAAKVPSSFWLEVFLVIIGFVIAVLILRKLLEINKFVFIVVGLMGTVILAFQWIYERNEPSFLTPVVDLVAPFFPSKGAYEIRQATDPTPGQKDAHPAPKH
jgi:hypothetical protein